MRNDDIETKIRKHFELYPYSKFSLSQINILVFNNDCSVKSLLEVLLSLTKPPDTEKHIKLQVRENYILHKRGSPILSNRISTIIVDLSKPYLNKRLIRPIRKIGMLIKPRYVFYRNL